MMQTTYVEPKNVREAQDRRLALVTEVQALQERLGSRKIKKNVAVPAGFWQWRQTAQAELVRKQKELSLLRAWLREHHDSDSSHKAVNFLRRGMNDVCKFIESLVRYSQHLRNRLIKYEKDLPEVPNFGVDEWRMQIDPLLKDEE